jgi:SPP1 gp7 family putative phage head morphogenesis protein
MAMSKRLQDVVNSNLYLFDLLFRHQVYLEGVKAGINVYFTRMLRELYGEFAKYIGQTRYDTLDGFTRVELQHFIQRFQVAQSHYYNQYTNQLIALLQQFVKSDFDISSSLYGEVIANPTSKRSAKQDAANGVSEPNSTPESIWAKASEEIVPASGQTVREMLMNFGTSMLTKVSQQIKIAYANNLKPSELTDDIIGSSESRFNDGLFSTFGNQNATILATLLQFFSTATQASIASEHYAQYQWISILDSKTTLICRSRNGNIYTYGEGPLPPAHWYCRSKIVALTQGEELHNIPSTFFEWVTAQPREFIDDAFVGSIAAKLVTKDVSLRDISISGIAKPLTISQFKNKIGLMTL